MQGSVAISSRKWLTAIRSGTWATKTSSPMTSRPRSASESAKGRPIRPSPTIATRVAMPARLARVANGDVAAPLAEELSCEGGHEAGIVVHVARQEPAGLLGDPVGPLE